MATKREIHDAQNEAAANVWREWKPHLLPMMLRSYPRNLMVAAVFMIVGLPRLWMLYKQFNFSRPFVQQFAGDVVCVFLLATLFAFSSVIFELLRERKAARLDVEQTFKPKGQL